MKILMKFMTMSFMLTMILMIAGQMLPTHKTDTKKISPYECGFDPIKSPRLPFSFRFFLMAILFILFDLEMALLLPLPISYKLKKTMKSSIYFSMFMIMLTIGLVYEWIKGGLDWAKD